MTEQDLAQITLPDTPGVYFFKGPKGEVLYIGRATSLRDRVRSYFREDLYRTRGKAIADMIILARSIAWKETASVIEAIILEAALIKKRRPPYNTKEKDNRSWNAVVVTKEEFPRVLLVRERVLASEKEKYLAVFGPFPSGGALKESLRIIRKIFPFRDRCAPGRGKPCFDAQIGLCPGVCTGGVSSQEYRKTIRRIMRFFSGKKDVILRELERDMSRAAKDLRFEDAAVTKRTIFSLQHIADVTLVGKEIREESRKVAEGRTRPFRIEAYDVAHLSGEEIVGAMTVVSGGEVDRKEYRKFRIQSPGGANDPLHIEEMLRRRFTHPEWPSPDLIVVDGGLIQKRRAEHTLTQLSLAIPIVAVLKDERHRPKRILGKRGWVASHVREILLSNAEAHRVANMFHRARRRRSALPPTPRRKG